MSVGVKASDEDHKKLIEMLNRLYEGMKGGQGKEVLGKSSTNWSNTPNSISPAKKGSLTRPDILRLTTRESIGNSSNRLNNCSPGTRKFQDSSRLA